MIASVSQALNGVALGPYADLRHGLAFPFQTSDNSGSQKTFPFEYGTESCTRKNAISPDANNRSVMWWEEAGQIRISKQVEGHTMFSAPIALMVWLNLKRISDDVLIGDKVMRDIVNRYESARLLNHASGVSIIKVEVMGIKTRSKEVFSRYSFESKDKLSVYPFDAARIEMNVHFVMACPDIELNPVC